MKIKGGEKRGNNRAGFDVCVQSLQSFRFNLELKKKSTLDLSPTCRTLYFFLCELASAPFLYLSFIPQQASVCLSSFLSFVLSFSVFSFPPPPAFLSQREDTFPCIPHDTGHLQRQKERERERGRHVGYLSHELRKAVAFL